MASRPSTGDAIDLTQSTASAPSVILVVDPDPDASAMYVEGLAFKGWIIDAETDGRVALAKAVSRRPAAIVTETRVPRLNGFELCRLLRSDPDTRHIPILVVTNDAEERGIAEAEEAGADRVLIKPCLPDELARAILATIGTARDPQPRRIGTAHGAMSKPLPSSHFKSRRFERYETTMPPSNPPSLVCPRCDRALTYQKSHVGGVSAKRSEQWDDYECPSGCGCFQFRQRTRTLRDVS